jgi:hypothetical protein
MPVVVELLGLFGLLRFDIRVYRRPAGFGTPFRDTLLSGPTFGQIKAPPERGFLRSG